MADGNDFNGTIIEEFRANAGRVGGPFEGTDMLILHHTGARSGAERATRDWYHNLVAHPDATVEVGPGTAQDPGGSARSGQII
jgi:F420H(2)-dependent quinone reductase